MKTKNKKKKFLSLVETSVLPPPPRFKLSQETCEQLQPGHVLVGSEIFLLRTSRYVQAVFSRNSKEIISGPCLEKRFISKSDLWGCKGYTGTRTQYATTTVMQDTPKGHSPAKWFGKNILFPFQLLVQVVILFFLERTSHTL